MLQVVESVVGGRRSVYRWPFSCSMAARMRKNEWEGKVRMGEAIVEDRDGTRWECEMVQHMKQPSRDWRHEARC